MEIRLVTVDPDNEVNYIRDAAQQLATEVNRLLNEEWRLQGGVAVSHNNLRGYTSVYLAQAMVK